jgi:DNA-binding IclR family transcriptional regulator
LPVGHSQDTGAVNGFPDTQLAVWSHRDLGETGRRVYAALTDVGQSVRAVTDTAMVSRATTYKKLLAMQELGLATKTAQGWALGTGNPEVFDNLVQEAASAARDRALQTRHP